MHLDPFYAEASVNDSRIAQYVTDLAERIQSGDSVDLETLCANDPDCLPRLRALRPTLEAIARLGKSLDGSLDGQQKVSVNDSAYSGILGDFRIIRELARGGMGIVYEAQQISLERRVA